MALSLAVRPACLQPSGRPAPPKTGQACKARPLVCLFSQQQTNSVGPSNSSLHLHPTCLAPDSPAFPHACLSPCHASYLHSASASYQSSPATLWSILQACTPTSRYDHAHHVRLCVQETTAPFFSSKLRQLRPAPSWHQLTPSLHTCFPYRCNPRHVSFNGPSPLPCYPPTSSPPQLLCMALYW